MKQIALSIEQMKHLEKLGLNTSDAYLAYDSTGYLTDKITAQNGGEIISAYTLQDILEKLPYELHNYTLQIEKIDNNKYSIYYYCSFETNTSSVGSYYDQEGENLLEAAYNMLVWCLKNNYIKTNKI